MVAGRGYVRRTGNSRWVCEMRSEPHRTCGIQRCRMQINLSTRFGKAKLQKDFASKLPEGLPLERGWSTSRYVGRMQDLPLPVPQPHRAAAPLEVGEHEEVVGVRMSGWRPARGEPPTEPYGTHRRHPGHRLVGVDGRPVISPAQHPCRTQDKPSSPQRWATAPRAVPNL